jgi:hypothetical protein
MKGKISLTLLCTAALAFACGPRTRDAVSSSNTTRDTRANAPSETRESDANVTRSNTPRDPNSPLTPSLDVAVDNGVRFDFTVVNESRKKLELDFANGRMHDLVVLDSLGREVWRWSEGRLFTQAMVSKVLRTSDSLRYEDSWKDAKPGHYTAVATLASANFPITQRVEFTVR